MLGPNEDGAEAYNRYLESLDGLRREQSNRVMPLIGALLDELDMLPNDTRQAAEEVVPELFSRLNAIQRAMQDPTLPDENER